MHNADDAARQRQQLEEQAIQQVLRSGALPTRLPENCVVYAVVEVLGAKHSQGFIDYMLEGCRFPVDVRTKLMERGIDIFTERWAAACFYPELGVFLICARSSPEIADGLMKELS